MGDPLLAVPFAVAAFLLLVGLGRLVTLFRLLAAKDAQDEAAAVSWDTGSRPGRHLLFIANTVAFLYVPAALLVGAGLAAEMALGHPAPATRALEGLGAGLALVSVVLLLFSNRLARHPDLRDGLHSGLFRRPVSSFNQALKNRGTNRFEVVLVPVLALTFGGLGVTLSGAPVACPVAQSTDEPQAARDVPPPGWQFARMPSRSNAPPDAAPRTETGQPSLRLDAGDFENPAPAHRGQASAPTDTTSVWLRLAALSRLEPPVAWVEPLLRPKQVFPIPDNEPNPPPDLFGTVARATYMVPAVWQVRVRSGASELGRCMDGLDGCGAETQPWVRFVEQSRDLRGVALYEAVNRFINSSIRFQSDTSLEAVLDDWITPASLVLQREGDCEDFALAKFWLLEMLGVDKADLYVVVVQDLVVNLPHAFLVVRSGTDVWLLDSRTNRVLAPDEVDGVVPVITIGDSAAYLHGRPDEGAASVPMSRLWDWIASQG